MKLKISILTSALLMLMPVGAAFAQDADDAACNTMLETSVGLSLREEGFTMADACSLTLKQLTEITNLVGQDNGMGKHAQIQKVLDDAKK